MNPEHTKLLNKYPLLHDGLSEMIEVGRLRREQVPGDYDWLAKNLAQLALTCDKVGLGKIVWKHQESASCGTAASGPFPSGQDVEYGGFPPGPVDRGAFFF